MGNWYFDGKPIFNDKVNYFDRATPNASTANMLRRRKSSASPARHYSSCGSSYAFSSCGTPNIVGCGGSSGCGSSFFSCGGG